MKSFVLIILVLAGNSVIAQQDSTETPFSANSASEQLSYQLTRKCKTDLEKVTAIFKWITDNINYSVRPLHSAPWTYPYAEPMDTEKLKPLDERVAENVLERRTATCDGYARLFKTLCYYARVRAELVTGYAGKDEAAAKYNFGCNHTWNAVLIDSAWHLLDVTWASGYVTWRGGEFIKEYDDRYFLPTPQNFIKDHYPDNIYWTLLDNPPVVKEFRQSPFRQRTFIKYQITDFRPSSGLIIAKQGDTVNIKITTEDAAKDRMIGADPFLDTSQFSTNSSVVLAPLSKKTTSDIIEYSYVVSSPGIQWLYILYNDDLILRYRLNILKPLSSLASIK